MPAITSGKVLVTGANGYIALWVVKTLLEKGYSVRGTVRSEAKKANAQKHFASYGDKLELVVVDDITKEGTFDEAVKGVDAIEHVASPLPAPFKDPQEIIKPAVEGTLTILNSALRSGTQVKRIVITSSVAAVFEMNVPAIRVVYSEKSWNRKAIREVEEQGANADPLNVYAASKTLADLAAWDWYEKKKAEGKLPFEIVTLAPPYVYGPWLHEVKDPSALGIPLNYFYQFIIQGNADSEKLKESAQWVDVRDLANAHVLSIEKEEAGDERLIISSGSFVIQDFVNAARKFSNKVKPGIGLHDAKHLVTLDTSRTEEVFPELPYRSIEDSTLAMIERLETLGWWTR